MPDVRLFPGPRFEELFRTYSLDSPRFREDGPDGKRFADEVRDRTPSPEEDAAARERSGVLRAALLRLPARESQVLRLRYGVGGGRPMSLQEIGDRIGITREGVRQRLLRAEEDLRAVIRNGVLPARANRRAFPGGYRRRT